MLTCSDVTVPNADELLDDRARQRRATRGLWPRGHRLDRTGMQRLVERLHDAGRAIHLEVVCLDADAELTSARAALNLGVDYLIGGTHWPQVSGLIDGSGIMYVPYPGQVTGHPASLAGTWAFTIGGAALDRLIIAEASLPDQLGATFCAEAEPAGLRHDGVPVAQIAMAPLAGRPELCREYLRNEAMWFGTSTMQPGADGCPGSQPPGRMGGLLGQ